MYALLRTACLLLMLPFVCHAQAQTSNLQAMRLAAKNITDQFRVSQADSLILVNSKSKGSLSNCIKSECRSLSATVVQFSPNSSPDSLHLLSSIIQHSSPNVPFVFLIDQADAQFLLSYAGRPDMGLKISSDQLCCDWLMPEEQFVRLTSIDAEENSCYQAKLRQALNTVDTIYISTDAGTNVRFIARNWVVDDGEIYCTPIEDKTNGSIVVDGCAYRGEPTRPIYLKIEDGKVVNISSLSDIDKQEKWIKGDLTADPAASTLCEVGIGTNKNALWNRDLMESEQARKTCHFGFGMNLNYGGKNESKTHIDLVVLDPTIEINGVAVYRKGILVNRQHLLLAFKFPSSSIACES